MQSVRLARIDADEARLDACGEDDAESHESGESERHGGQRTFTEDEGTKASGKHADVRVALDGAEPGGDGRTEHKPLSTHDKSVYYQRAHPHYSIRQRLLGSNH
jgi:hypothetical protein